MIKSNDELTMSHEALGNLYRALASLRNEFVHRPDVFASLAEGPLAEITRITSEIEEYAGVSIAVLEPATLWLRLVGEKAHWRETSASVVTAFLDALRKGVQAIAAFNSSGHILGRPASELQRACDFELVAFHAGSFRIGMSLPDPPQRELFRVTDSSENELAEIAAEALHEYLEVARWASTSRDLSELNEVVRDAAKRRIALRAVRPLVPRTGGGIDAVELTGKAVASGAPIRVTHDASARLAVALEDAVADVEETYVGDVREMDLDRRTFKLRNIKGSVVQELICHLAEDISPIISEYLGKRARVIGTRATASHPLNVVDIESLEASDEYALERRGA